jgi:uncharacterized protein
MTTNIDKRRFGPWAVITGASSGIGKEFARQIAASGINVVLVARRKELLDSVGAAIAKEFKVEYRTVVADLSEENATATLLKATSDLDVGLVISNAGTGNPGKFLTIDRQTLINLLKLNTLAHLEIAHSFGERLVKRKRGGMLFVGAMGSDKGIPFMANDAGAKAYLQSFSQALHAEWQPLGIHVTVLPVGPTDTPVLEKFGLTPDMMPMKPMTVEQCVSEGMQALQHNYSLHIPGLLNRIMNQVTPAPIVRSMMGSMFEKIATKAKGGKTAAQTR